MKLVDCTLPSPPENLALDEALLDLAEEREPGGFLRFWESDTPFVVLGYSNQLEREVHVSACRSAGVPILRRISGGGTVLQAPGCLNYAVVLPNAAAPRDTLTAVNHFVLEHLREALGSLLPVRPDIRGHTDLTLDGRKISGNSQRRKKTHAVVHGTVLLNLDMALVERYLKMPTLQPSYRSGRSHRDFMTNLQLSSDLVKDAMRRVWDASTAMDELPLEKTRALVREKYGVSEWTARF
jgi:lipoate-protein ligase A